MAAIPEEEEEDCNLLNKKKKEEKKVLKWTTEDYGVKGKLAYEQGLGTAIRLLDDERILVKAQSLYSFCEKLAIHKNILSHYQPPSASSSSCSTVYASDMDRFKFVYVQTYIGILCHEKQKHPVEYLQMLLTDYSTLTTNRWHAAEFLYLYYLLLEDESLTRAVNVLILEEAGWPFGSYNDSNLPTCLLF